MSGYLEGAPHPIPFAHRGGALLPGNEGIENTIAAFQRAHDLGYRHLETDVHVSADAVVYAFHDTDLQRLTGAPTSIAGSPSAVVDAVRLRDAEPVPRLTDLLEAFPDCRFNIDVKADAAVEPTLAVLARHGVLDRVCLGAFSHARLRRLRTLAPRVCTALSPLEIGLLRLARWPRVGPPGLRCVQVPVRQGRVEILTPGLVRLAHRLGHPVHVWTIDDPAEMHRLLDLGVDGIFTDRPDTLRDVLRARDAWTAPA